MPFVHLRTDFKFCSLKLLLTGFDIASLLGDCLFAICNVGLRAWCLSVNVPGILAAPYLYLFQLGILVVFKVGHFLLEAFAFCNRLLLFGFRFFNRLAQLGQFLLASSHIGGKLRSMLYKR